MTTIEHPPVVPIELSSFWDEHAQEQHERLASWTLGQFIEAMPESYFGGYFTARYVDLPPTDNVGKVVDHDRNSAVVITAPYTNGWEPHIGIRAITAQKLLPEPMRFIIFPDNSWKQVSYVINDRDKAIVASGNAEPIADKQAKSLEDLKIVKVHNVSSSFGVMVDAKTMRLAFEGGRFEIGNSGLFEPPNAVDRAVGDLEKAFFKTGAKTLNDDIQESAIPALVESQQAYGSITSNARQKGRILLSYAYSWLNNTPRAVKKGMASDSFIDDYNVIKNHAQGVNIIAAGGEQSTVFPLDIQRKLGAFTIEGKKHSMTDNVVLNALLARMVIFGR